LKIADETRGGKGVVDARKDYYHPA
jgi:hypothetical protein